MVTVGSWGVPGDAITAPGAVPVAAAVMAAVWVIWVELGTTVGAAVGFAGRGVAGVAAAPASCSAGAPSGAAWADGVPSGGVISTPCPTNASATATRPTTPAYRFDRDPHTRMNVPLVCNRMLAAWPALDIPLLR